MIVTTGRVGTGLEGSTDRVACVTVGVAVGRTVPAMVEATGLALRVPGTGVGNTPAQTVRASRRSVLDVRLKADADGPAHNTPMSGKTPTAYCPGEGTAAMNPLSSETLNGKLVIGFNKPPTTCAMYSPVVEAGKPVTPAI